MLVFFVYRFILSLTSCKSCMAIDDQLNILPISSHTLNITALPPKSKVNFLFIAYTHSPLWSRGRGVEWKTSSKNYYRSRHCGSDERNVFDYSLEHLQYIHRYHIDLKISSRIFYESAASNRVQVPALKALSDRAKFCCIAAALFALQ